MLLGRGLCAGLIIRSLFQLHVDGGPRRKWEDNIKMESVVLLIVMEHTY